MTSPTLETLVDRHQREMMAYIVRSMGDFDLAEDVFQETFLRAFRALASLGAEANHRAWLYKIASNACRDARRRLARRPLPLDESMAAPPGPDGEDRALVAAVIAFVRGLPARQQQTLLLRKFQGLDYDEIAVALGCTPEAARASVYQGLRKLRAHFAEVTRG